MHIQKPVGGTQSRGSELVWELIFAKELRVRALHLSSVLGHAYVKMLTIRDGRTEETEPLRLEMVAGRAVTAQEFDASL